MGNELLTRDAFRAAVFERDAHKCVACYSQGQDAHHIMERRLFPDGGYYLDNGATLCGLHHQQAESTELQCDTLRCCANIQTIILPPHLYHDQTYDKWGNPLLPNGTRLRGELFDDESVQKVLRPVLGQFTDLVKYPRTYHLPWSLGVSKDDRALTDLSDWEGTEVVVTEKMDGENTTMYPHYMHARSLDYAAHPSRDRVKAIHGSKSYDIPDGWRVCGENVTAQHSIGYADLPDYFLVFGIWNGLTCMSWDDTADYTYLLGFKHVPVLYRGKFNEIGMRGWDRNADWWTTMHEGYVVRPAAAFHYRDFRKVVGKFVRANHVTTHDHWMRQRLTYNTVTKAT